MFSESVGLLEQVGPAQNCPRNNLQSSAEICHKIQTHYFFQGEMHYLNILNNAWVKFTIEFVFAMLFTRLWTEQISSPDHTNTQTKEQLRNR